MSLYPKTVESKRLELLLAEVELNDKANGSLLFDSSYSFKLGLKSVQQWKVLQGGMVHHSQTADGKKCAVKMVADDYFVGKDNEVLIKKLVIRMKYVDSFCVELPCNEKSDSTLIDKMNLAGILFIKYGKYPPMNKIKRRFSAEVKDLSSLEAITNTIAASLKTISIIDSTGTQTYINTNPDDMKFLITNAFTAVLKSSNIIQKINHEWSSPLIVSDEIHVGWMQMDFSCHITYKGDSDRTKKVDVKLNLYSYLFPTMKYFDYAFKMIKANLAACEV